PPAPAASDCSGALPRLLGAAPEEEGPPLLDVVEPDGDEGHEVLERAVELVQEAADPRPEDGVALEDVLRALLALVVAVAGARLAAVEGGDRRLLELDERAAAGGDLGGVAVEDLDLVEAHAAEGEHLLELRRQAGDEDVQEHHGVLPQPAARHRRLE